MNEFLPTDDDDETFRQKKKGGSYNKNELENDPLIKNDPINDVSSSYKFNVIP